MVYALKRHVAVVASDVLIVLHVHDVHDLNVLRLLHQISGASRSRYLFLDRKLLTAHNAEADGYMIIAAATIAGLKRHNAATNATRSTGYIRIIDRPQLCAIARKV